MSKKLVALYSSLVIGITCMSSFVNANAIYLSGEYCDKKGLIFYDNIINNSKYSQIKSPFNFSVKLYSTK